MRHITPYILLALTVCLYADEPKVADKSNAIVAELLNQVEVLHNQGQAAVARTEMLFDEEVAKLKAKQWNHYPLQWMRLLRPRI